MNYFGYDLELALREMDEFQRQAARDAMVKEMKNATREKRKSSRWSLLRCNLAKLFKRTPKVSINSTFAGQSSLCASEDD